MLRPAMAPCRHGRRLMRPMPIRPGLPLLRPRCLFPNDSLLHPATCDLSADASSPPVARSACDGSSGDSHVGRGSSSVSVDLQLPKMFGRLTPSSSTKRPRLVSDNGQNISF